MSRFFLLSTLLIYFVVPLAGHGQDVEPVVIDYFYDAGCIACQKVRNEILPELDERFHGFYVLKKHDLGRKTSVLRLVAYQEEFEIKDNKPVSMIIDYEHALNGFAAIKNQLFDYIDLCIAKRIEPGWKRPRPITVPEDGDHLRERASGFTLSAVLLAGLIDGINPCAISTLVFFMSILIVSKVKNKGLLLMGAAYCVATFVTYTLMGFGFLRFLHCFQGFPMLQTGVELVIACILVAFAGFSFRDAYRYRCSGDAKAVTIQLPVKIKKRIHDVIRRGLKTRYLILGGLLIGTAVTALESVCTGQVYIPALALIIKDGAMVSEAWNYLIAYNTVFILPIVVVFALTYRGLQTEKLIRWTKINVVVSKILLGLFFVSMAVLLMIL